MLLCSCISEYALQKFIKIWCDIMLVDFELSLIEYDNMLIIRSVNFKENFSLHFLSLWALFPLVFKLIGSKWQRLAANNTS